MYFKSSVVKSMLGRCALGLLWKVLLWHQGMHFPHPKNAVCFTEHKTVSRVKGEEVRQESLLLFLELLSTL